MKIRPVLPKPLQRLNSFTLRCKEHRISRRMTVKHNRSETVTNMNTSLPEPQTRPRNQQSAEPKPRLVLHVVKALGLGGTEKVMQLMVSNLNTAKFTPAVCSLQGGEREALLRECGVPVFVQENLFETIVKLKPSLIHMHRAGWPEPEFMRPVLAARRFLKRESGLPVPVVETNVFGRLDPSSEGKAVNSTLFVSHFCAQRFAAVHQITTAAPRYFVLYNPIDYQTICNIAPTPDQRNYALPVAGRVSRADPGKWSDLALNWVPAVCAARPDFSYLVVGGIKHAYDYVQQHNLSAQVQFMPPFINDADLAVFLSKISVFAHANDTGESFGLVIAEAMAAGLPVITHPAEGLRDNAQLELVDHNRTGLIVQNPEEYANAVLWLLNNPTEARRLGQAGQAKAAQFFCARVIASQLEQIYETLLSTTAAPLPS